MCDCFGRMVFDFETTQPFESLAERAPSPILRLDQQQRLTLGAAESVVMSLCSGAIDHEPASPGETVVEPSTTFSTSPGAEALICTPPRPIGKRDERGSGRDRGCDEAAGAER